jgi:hypothetical protein
MGKGRCVMGLGQVHTALREEKEKMRGRSGRRVLTSAELEPGAILQNDICLRSSSLKPCQKTKSVYTARAPSHAR